MFLYARKCSVALDACSSVHLSSPPRDGQRLIEPVKRTTLSDAEDRPVKWRGGHPPLIRLLLSLEAPTQGSEFFSGLLVASPASSALVYTFRFPCFILT